MTLCVWFSVYECVRHIILYAANYSILDIILKKCMILINFYHNTRHFLVNSILVTNFYFTVVCIDKIFTYQTIETKLLFNQINPRMVHWVHLVHSKSHYLAAAVLFCFVSHWLFKLSILVGVMGLIHDDVIKWKLFPRYWPFVWGIHRSPVNSPHKGPVMRTLMFLWCGSAYAVKQTVAWPVIWYYMTSMWRHRNVTYISKVYFTGAGALIWLSQSQWNNPEDRVNINHLSLIISLDT